MERLCNTGLAMQFTYQRTVLALLLAWSAAVGGLAWWYHADHTANLTEMARIYARACHEKDVIYRRWNAVHGGVYVAISKNCQPNPYLHAAEREITTPSGRTLTLVNPAFMTRQVHELAANADNIQAHITSLKPLNPKNTPDKWEREALLSFEKGEQEASLVLKQDNKHAARLMRPLYVEQSCMKCHEEQGYKIGDVRGGISVTVPVDSIWKAQTQQARDVFVALGGIWMIGAVAIVLVGRSTNQHRLDRKQAMEALQESEKRFKDVMYSSSDAILLIENNTFVDCNEATARMLGYDTRDEVVMAHPSKLSPPKQPDGKDSFEKAEEMIRLAFDQGFQQFEWIHRRANGEDFPVEVSLTPIVHQGQTLLYCVWRDITEQKQSEQQIRNYTAALRSANKALEESIQVAECANRAKSEFLANMSHEIRTPMTAILGFCDVLLEKASFIQKVDAAKTIKRNAEHLLTLINDILDLSKIEAGKLSLESAPCRPKQMLDDVVSLMKVKADAKRLPLEFHCDQGVPDMVSTDPVRLRQILVNLIGNAIKFTETGFVKVSMEPETNPDGQTLLRLDVTDTGIGMESEEVASIFEPFSQGDASTTRKFGGTGLGLTISKRLAERLGGDITVESEIQKGSTFTLRIEAVPIDEALHCEEEYGPDIAQDKSSKEVKTIPPGCRILLAEDGFDNQRLISLLLKKAGASVQVAENGLVAAEVTMAADEPFDLILMDMQMPLKDGYEATRELRQAGYEGPIIALTANAMKDDEKKCLDAGCDAYLAKPIDREKLIQTVAQFSQPKQALVEHVKDAT